MSLLLSCDSRGCCAQAGDTQLKPALSCDGQNKCLDSLQKDNLSLFFIASLTHRTEQQNSYRPRPQLSVIEVIAHVEVICHIYRLA